MHQINTEHYNGLLITYFVTDQGKFIAKSIASLVSKVTDTLEECRRSIYNTIDDFRLAAPVTYKELAHLLTEGLSWKEDNSPVVDERLCEHYVSNFVKLTYNKINATKYVVNKLFVKFIKDNGSEYSKETLEALNSWNKYLLENTYGGDYNHTKRFSDDDLRLIIQLYETDLAAGKGKQILNHLINSNETWARSQEN